MNFVKRGQNLYLTLRNKEFGCRLVLMSPDRGQQRATSHSLTDELRQSHLYVVKAEKEAGPLHKFSTDPHRRFICFSVEQHLTHGQQPEQTSDLQTDIHLIQQWSSEACGTQFGKKKGGVGGGGHLLHHHHTHDED